MKRNMYGAMNPNHKSLMLAIGLLFALSASISAAPGDLDPTFGNGGKRTDWTGFASGVAIQPDGKIVVVGGCCSPGNDFRVARYNPDGSPDTTFGGGTGRVTTDFNGNQDSSDSVVLQPDGKIIVAGWAALQSSGFSLAVARYNPDGSLDTTFGGGSGKVLAPLPDYFGFGQTDVAIQPDGRILVVLAQYDLNDNDYGLLVRYNADGSPDTSFGMGGSVLSQFPMFSVTVQPADGKVVVKEGYGDHRIARFNTNGSLDTGFGSGGRVTLPVGFWCFSLAVDSAGKIVTAGRSASGSTFEFALLRFNVDGSPDSSFDGDGIVTTPGLEMANSIVVQSNGKIVVAGYGPGPGNYDLALARYNSNGSLDNTFGGGDGITTVDFNNSSDFGIAVALDNQGRGVVVGGSQPLGGGPFVFALARFLGDAIQTPTCSNPIDCADFFVRQHYLDFLNREPDIPGWNHWTGEITECSDPAKRFPGESFELCTERKRANTSAAFFLSPEFQNTGSFILRVYWGTLGKSLNAQCPGVPMGLLGHCRPLYSEYIADMATITQGIVVNDALDPVRINANKQAFVAAFVQRPDFRAVYDVLNNTQFVDRLFQTTGISPSSGDRQALIDGLNSGTETRASVVFKIVDGTTTTTDGLLVFNTTYGQAFYNQEFDTTFVMMEYLGYLRRNPDQAGYDFWLAKLRHYGNWVDAQMVLAFIISPEYRSRFAP